MNKIQHSQTNVISNSVLHHASDPKKPDTVSKIDQINIRNLQKSEIPKSKENKSTLWERFKESCCIRRIIAIWHKLFGSTHKKNKPTDGGIPNLNPKSSVEETDNEPKLIPNEKIKDDLQNENTLLFPEKNDSEEQGQGLNQDDHFEENIPETEKQENDFEELGPKVNQEEHFEENIPETEKKQKNVFKEELQNPKKNNEQKKLSPQINEFKEDKKISPPDLIAHDQPIVPILTEPAIEFAPEELDQNNVENTTEDKTIAGLRSIQMFQFLRQFPAYDEHRKMIKLQGKDYIPLTAAVQDISKKAVASCGSSKNREIIVLDPQNSPELDKHFGNLLIQLQNLQKERGRSLTEEEVLKQVQDYVRHDIFPTRCDPDLQQKLDNFVKLYFDNPNVPKTKYRGSDGRVDVPIIPIDDFIKKGLGVCRHHAMVTAYILDKLTKEPLGSRFLEGTVQHMRENITIKKNQMCGHIWVTLVNSKEKKRWHVDTLWREVVDFSIPSQVEYLKGRYGSAIDNQIRKVSYVEHKLKGKQEKTKEGIDKDVFALNSLEAKGFLELPGRSKNRYIVSDSSSNKYDYTISYLDENSEYKKVRIKINLEGQIETEKPETFNDFDAFKKQYKLDQCYTPDEIASRWQIERELAKDFNDYQEAEDFLIKANSDKDFLIRYSSVKDCYTLHYTFKVENEIRHLSYRFTVNSEGKIEFCGNKGTFDNINGIKEKFKLNRQIKKKDPLPAITS